MDGVTLFYRIFDGIHERQNEISKDKIPGTWQMYYLLMIERQL